MCFDSLVKILQTSRRLIFSAFSPWAENPLLAGVSVRLSVNTTHPPVLKISTTGFCIKFRTHGRETLRKDIGTFLNWKPEN
jgi:hypothetical protein